MARDQQPVTDAEIEAFREELEAQRQEIREQLAEDLGGEPEDYDAERYFAQQADGDGTGEDGEVVPDGGE